MQKCKHESEWHKLVVLTEPSWWKLYPHWNSNGINICNLPIDNLNSRQNFLHTPRNEIKWNEQNTNSNNNNNRSSAIAAQQNVIELVCMCKMSKIFCKLKIKPFEMKMKLCACVCVFVKLFSVLPFLIRFTEIVIKNLDLYTYTQCAHIRTPTNEEFDEFPKGSSNRLKLVR